MYNEPTTPLHEILDQVKDMNEGSELLAVLNFLHHWIAVVFELNFYSRLDGDL